MKYQHKYEKEEREYRKEIMTTMNMMIKETRKIIILMNVTMIDTKMSVKDIKVIQ